MTAITLNEIQSGYNLQKVNENFTILEDNINNDVLHTENGGNTMNQDIDMDGNSIFNLTTNPSNLQSAVSLQYLKEFTGVDEGIDERVDRLEVLSTDRIVIDLLGALTYNLTVTEALHTSISFSNPHSSGSTLVTIPNAPEMPVRFYVHNGGPYNLEFVGVTGTPLVIKPGTTPLFKDLSTGEVYTSYAFSQPYEGSVVQSSLATSLQELLTEVQAGTPTNTMVVAGDSMQDVVWKLQGQITSQHSIAFVDLTDGDRTITEAETAAPIILFTGTPTGSVAVTSTSSVGTRGAHYVLNITNEIVVLDGAVELSKHVSGVVVVMNDGASFSLALPTKPAQSPAVEMSGTSYNVNDLQAGVYYYFTHASAVNLTVQTNSTKAISDYAEFYFKRRGAGDLTLVEGTDGVDTVDIIPPKGGSLILEDGDFCVLKRTAVDVFDLVGSTK